MKSFHFLIQEAELFLRPYSTDYRVDIESLICFVFELSKSDLLACLSQESGSLQKEDRFWALVKERSKGKPLAYLIGTAFFMGHEYFIEEGVLIPRPETEVLVRQTSKLIEEKRLDFPVQVLECGVGSGIVGIELALLYPELTIVGWDISSDAVRIAKRNADHFGCSSLQFIHGDFFESCLSYLNNKDIYTIIVSNPPYISECDIKSLDVDVKEYEPHQALCGGADGLEYYRLFSQLSLTYLVPVITEIGFDQKLSIQMLIQDLKQLKCRFFKDDEGLDRVLNLFL